MEYLDKNYSWTCNKLLGALYVSLFPGGIIAIGLFVQNIILVRYKKELFNLLRQRDKK